MPVRRFRIYSFFLFATFEATFGRIIWDYRRKFHSFQRKSHFWLRIATIVSLATTVAMLPLHASCLIFFQMTDSLGYGRVLGSPLNDVNILWRPGFRNQSHARSSNGLGCDINNPIGPGDAHLPSNAKQPLAPVSSDLSALEAQWKLNQNDGRLFCAAIGDISGDMS